jgi:hypothetical protein
MNCWTDRHAALLQIKKKRSLVGILNMAHIPKITLVITDRNEGRFAAATVGEGRLCCK